MKIRAKTTGEIIDLATIRQEQVYIGNPYAVETAILIKHNTALLDALEAACRVTPASQFDAHYVGGYNTALADVRDAAGVIEESA